MHSSAFSPFCLLNLQNFSDFIISLNRGLNLLVNISNKPSNVLNVSFSACVNDSMKCRSFQPNQFSAIAKCSFWCVLYVVNILLTSNLKVLSLLYLSSASQLKLGCFLAGLPILGPTMLFDLYAVATAIACIAALVTSATALAIASFPIDCSLAIVNFDLFIVYVCLNETFTTYTM